MLEEMDKIWAADLVDMKTFANDNEGVKYLLTVLDVFLEIRMDSNRSRLRRVQR